MVFDDAATTPFAGVTAARAPFTGTWKPFEPLDGLLDGAADGDWKFKVDRRRARGHRLAPRRVARADGVRHGLSAFSAASTSASVL